MTDIELQALTVLAREEIALMEFGTARVNQCVAQYGECPFDPNSIAREPRPACDRLTEELIDRGLLSAGAI